MLIVAKRMVALVNGAKTGGISTVAEVEHRQIRNCADLVMIKPDSEAAGSAHKLHASNAKKVTGRFSHPSVIKTGSDVISYAFQ